MNAPVKSGRTRDKAKTLLFPVQLFFVPTHPPLSPWRCGRFLILFFLSYGFVLNFGGGGADFGETGISRWRSIGRMLFGLCCLCLALWFVHGI